MNELAERIEKLLAEARRLSEDSAGMAQRIQSEVVQGVAAEGRVVAYANGFGVVHDVQLDPLAMRELDNMTLGEAIRDAIIAAERASEAVRNEVLDELRVEGRSVREIFEQGPDLSGLEAQINRLRSL